MTIPPRAPRRPLVHRDADGHERTAASWESLTERLIREAQADGRFDDLPHQGRRMHLEDDVHAGDMALAHHVLRNAGVAPPWVEADKEVRRLRSAIEALIDRPRRRGPATGPALRLELERLIAQHDDAIGSLEGLAPTPRQHRRRLDADDLRARLEAALAAEDERA